MKSKILKLLRQNEWDAYLFILPAVLLIFMFLLFPAIWVFIGSFKDMNPIEIRMSGIFSVPGKMVGFKNYLDVFTYDLFWKSTFNTFKLILYFLPTTMLFALLLAQLVNQKTPVAKFLRSLSFLPTMISAISISLIFLFIFNSDRGLINQLLRMVNIKGPMWFSRPEPAMLVIALLLVWRRVGYYALIYLAGLQGIPDELYESAGMDGASGFQKFIYITWPSLNRIHYLVFVLLLIEGFNVFQEIFIVTGGGPGDATVTLPFLIYRNAFSFFRLSTASAVSYILFTMIVIVTFIQNKVIGKKFKN